MQDVKVSGGQQVYLHAFLTSALEEVVDIMYWPLYPRRKYVRYLLKGCAPEPV
jgi:hypothetical protein